MEAKGCKGDPLGQSPISEADKNAQPKPCVGNLRGEMKVVPFGLNAIHGLSKLRVSVPQDLKERQARDGMKVGGTAQAPDGDNRI